jgi:hypothetical protein
MAPNTGDSALAGPADRTAAAIDRPRRPQRQRPSPSPWASWRKLISDYWQFAGVIASIAAAISTAFTYFATSKEVHRVECMTTSNLLVATLPNRVDQLETKITLAQERRSRLDAGSPEVAQELDNIERWKQERADANKKYDAALDTLKLQLCDEHKDTGK